MVSGEDRLKWNERHAARAACPAGGPPLEPAPFLAEALDALAARGWSGRTALDVAAGRGRHALALARAGFDVLAVDVSDVAMAELAERAARERLRLEARAWDLDAGLPPGRFDLVVVVHFLDRALFPALRDALVPGGALIVETFTTARGEMNPAFCLEPGELARLTAGLEPLILRETPDGLAQFLGRIR